MFNVHGRLKDAEVKGRGRLKRNLRKKGWSFSERGVDGAFCKKLRCIKMDELGGVAVALSTTIADSPHSIAQYA